MNVLVTNTGNNKTFIQRNVERVEYRTNDSMWVFYLKNGGFTLFGICDFKSFHLNVIDDSAAENFIKENNITLMRP